MSVLDTFPEFAAESREVWRAWLEKNHKTCPGIWLVYRKAASGLPTVKYAEAVEEALCFGWIDSKQQSIDETSFRQVYTPRKTKSVWSALNKRRVTALREAGLMTGAGEAIIRVGMENGSWTALDDIENLVEPPEFKAAFDAVPEARANYIAWPKSVRKGCLFRLSNAKREATRQKLLAELVDKARQNVRP